MICISCGKEFEGRSDARYCSALCRVTFSRKGGLSVTSVTDNGEVVTDNVTDKIVRLDLEKDLKLDLKKDLGVSAWTDDGIFITADITEEQVRRIRRLVEAKHGWTPREYA